MKSPIVFFAFNRPVHTKKSLDSLINNKECLQSSFFSFVDGPRNNLDNKNIKEVISIIKSYKKNFKSFKIVTQKTNQGCATQVISNLSKVFETFNSLIYLEDDIVVSKHFLSFINSGLYKYENNIKVKSISGFSFNAFNSLTEPFFLRTFFTWGFGLWKRTWSEFDHSTPNLIEILKQKKCLSKFTYDFSNYNLDSYNKFLKGQKGAWDVRLSASILLNDGLTLIPHKSLTQNIGTDGTGTNFTFSTNKYDVSLYNNPIIHFPELVIESKTAYKLLVNFYKSKQSAFLYKLKYFFQRLILKRTN